MNSRNRRLVLPIAILLAMAVSLGMVTTVPSVHAQPAPGSAVLGIVPINQTLPAPGGNLVLNVTFGNFPTFAGWDIAIKTNQAVLKPTLITLVQTFGGTSSVFTNCVNGVGQGCSSPPDGSGVATSAVSSLGGSATGNGTLFQITYQVVAGPVTNVTFVSSATTSVVTDPSGFTVVDCTATPVQCMSGTIAVTDFAISARPATLGPVGPGVQASSTISVMPESGFLGVVNLVATAPAGVTANLATPSVTIVDTNNQTDVLTVSSTNGCGGTCIITITGSSAGFVNRVTTVALKVIDFALSASPNPVSFVRGTPSSSVITVSSLNTFSGTVSLALASPAAVTASLNVTSVNVTPTASGHVLLSLSSSTPGTYLVNVTGTSAGFPTHVLTVTVVVNKTPSTTATTVVNEGATTTTGASFHDTATVTATGGTPTGTVTYSRFNNALCTAPAVTTQTVTISGTTVPVSASTGPLAAGSYSFRATYNGDGSFAASTSACEPFTVSKATPTVSTTVVLKSGAALPSPVPFGSAVNDTATVTGATGFAPTGTLVYSFFKNGLCTAPAFTTLTVTLTTAGVVPNSATSGALIAGNYSYTGAYSGNTNYNAATGSCEPFTVAKAASTISTTVVLKSGAALPSPVPFGSIVNDTATITGVSGFTPTGTLIYNFFTNGGCTGTATSTSTVALAAGAVPHSGQQGPLGAGSYSFNGVYGGDTNYNPSTSACEPFTVAKAASNTTTVASTSTGVTGSTASDTAAVSQFTGFTVTGTYLYSFFTNGACTGTASTTQNVTLTGGVVPGSSATGALGAGSYCFQGKYSGDTNYLGSTSPIEPITIAKTTSSTATVASTSTGVTGSTASDTATVTGATGFAPTGTYLYSFFTNGACTAPASTTQNVTLTAGSVPNSAATVALGAGSYCFQGKYSGDANYLGSTSAIEPFGIAKTTSSTATVASTSTGVTGSTASDTATVTGVTGFAPTGTYLYSFFTNGACTAPASTTQNVTLTGGTVPGSTATAALGAGSYCFQGKYSGDANYLGSTSAIEPVAIAKAASTTATTVVQTTPSVTGSSASDTATVAGVTGFTRSGTLVYSFFTNGACTAPASTTQTVTLTAGAVPNSASTAALAAGSYSFQGAYSGDANYLASTSACEPFTVAKATPSTATAVVQSTPSVTGSTASDTATVTGVTGFTPSGSYTYNFFTNGVCTAPASTTQTVTLASGVVPGSASTAALGAGSYSFQGSYGGDGNYLVATSACEPFTVAKATPATATTVVSETTSAFHDTATISAVTGFTPSGTLVYSRFNGGVCAAPAVTTQTVTLTGGAVPASASTGTLAAGSYSFQGAYSGDANYLASSSSCEPFTAGKNPSSTATVVVNDGTSTVTGASFHDTATVTGVTGTTPTGTYLYSFFNNGACTGTVVTNQNVTLSGGLVPNSASTGPLAAGSYCFQGRYSGDANYNPSASATEPFTIGKAASSTATVASASTGVTGSTASDTATVTGVTGFTPTGTYLYSFFTNGACTAPASTTQNVTLTGGVVPGSSATAALAAGSYCFQGKYSGDANYLGSTSATEPVTIAKATPTTRTTVVQSTPSVTGSTASDTATVAGVTGFTPSGTLVYSFFTNGVCTAPASTTQTVTLTAGAVPNSASTVALAAGSYSFQGAYSGDANYLASTSACEPFTVAKAASTTATVVVQTTPSVTGSTASDTATVTGVTGFTPSGTLVYSFFTNGACTAPASTTQTVTLASGAVPNSASTAALGAGSYSFQGAYSGDGNYLASTSSCEPFTVAKAASSTATTVVQSTPSVTGSTASDTATVTGVTGFTPSGSYTYNFFTNGVCTAPASTTQTVTLASGAVPNSASTAALGAGSYSFQGSYAGDGNYLASTSACEPFTVAKAASLTATTVVQSTPSVTGSTGSDTSTVSGVTGFTPSGTLVYSRFNNGACTGTAVTTQTVTLTGGSVPASASTGPLAAGSYSFQGAYSGDANYLASTSTCEPFTVAKAASSTATVASTSTGVTGSTASDTATVTGVTGFTATGTYVYSFFTNGACTAPASTTQNVTLTGGTVPGSTATAALGAGSYCFQGKYSGDANYLGSTSAIEPVTIAKATPNTATVVVSESTTAFHDTATVTGVTGITPSGTLVYSRFNNAACTGTAVTTQTVTLTGGTVPASASTGTLAAGNYSFTGAYSGDANYLASTGACEPFAAGKNTSSTATVVVNDGTSTVTGASFHDTATVTGVTGITPSGTLVYSRFNNGVCTAPTATTQTVTLVGGVVPNSASTGPLGAGSYSFQAVYGGDTNYSASTGACEPFTIAKAASTSATVTSRSTGVTGSTASDSATVTGVTGFTATGTYVYSFFTNGACTAPASTTQTVTLASGAVPNSASTAALAPGSYSFQGAYSGDANYLAATSACEPFTIAKAAPTTATTVVSEASSSFHDTATVTGVSGFTPTGTYLYSRFNNGACTAPAVTTQNVTLTGGTVPASASTGTLATGSYSFQGKYSGDANYLGVTSSCEPFSVAAATSFTVTVTPTTISNLDVGIIANANITVTGHNGFNGNVTISVTVSPSTGLLGTLRGTQRTTVTVLITPTGTTVIIALAVNATNAQVGNYVMTITGTSPGFTTQTATLNVQVVNFIITSSPNPMGPIAAASSASSTVTVTGQNGYTGTVSLSAVGFGASTTLSATSPNPCALSATVTSCTATLTGTADVAGTYEIDISGSDAFITNTAVTHLVVNDFSVTANPSDVGPLAPNVNGTSIITVSALNGFTGTVTVTLSPSPGLTASISQSTFQFTSTGAKRINATLTVKFTTSATYTVDVTGTSPGYSTAILGHSVRVTVVPSPTLFISPATHPTVAPGSFVLSQVRVTGFPLFNGYDITIQTDPNVLSPNSVSFTGDGFAGSEIILTNCINGAGLGCGANDGAGIVHVAVASLGGGASGDALLFTINYTAVSGQFTISANPNPMGPIAATGSASSTITVTGTNATTSITILNDDVSDPSGTSITHSKANGSQTVSFRGTVSLSAVGFGASTSLSATIPSPCALTTGTSCTATLSATADVAGTYEIDITGSTSILTNTLMVHLIVNDFKVTANPIDVGPVSTGSSGTSTITVSALNGFTGTVTLTLSPAPGLTASLSQSMFTFTSTGPTKLNATLTLSFTVPGTYAVVVTGTSPGYSTALVNHSVTVTVFPPATVFISPSSQAVVSPGSVVLYQVRVVGFPTFNGYDVSVRTDPNVLNPTSVSLTGDMFGGSEIIVTNCINGAGLGCGASDGVGIVHVSVASLGGQASGDGLLFTISYTAVSGQLSITANPNPLGPIAAASSASSTITVTGINATTSITIFNDDFSDPSGASVPHSTVNGSQSVRFVGTVSVSAVGFGASTSLSATSPNPCALSATVTSCTATLTATADVAGTYEIDITAAGTVISNTLIAHLIVNDFSITSSSTSIGPLSPNTNGSTTITVTALNGFTGTVTLTLSPSTGLTASLSQTMFTFTSTSPTRQNATLTVSYSTLATYTVTVTGTSSGYPTKSLTIAVIPPATVLISPSSMSVAPTGSFVLYQVRVVGFPTFNGYDISVRTNPAVLSPNGISFVGDVFQGNEIIGTQCINGVGIGCGSTDGPGVVHLAVASLGGGASGDGVLFTINYTAVAGPDFTLSASPMTVGPLAPNAQGTSTVTLGNLFGSSVTIFNDDITDPSGVSIPHATLSGTYGAGATISLTVSPSSGLTAMINPTSITFNPSDISKTATLTVSAGAAGNYAVMITGTGPTTHTITVNVQVTDFTVTVNPSSISNLAPNTTGTVTVTVTGLNGFTGTVTLTATPSSGLTANISPTTVTLSATVTSATATLSVSAASAGNYSVVVTGSSSGFPSHSATVTVAVTDFTVQCSPCTINPPAGTTSGSTTIMVTGLNGFAGTVTLTLQSSSGLTASINPTTISLSSTVTSGTATLQVSATASGTYTVLVTGTAPGFPNEASHTAHVTVTISTTTSDFKISASPNFITGYTQNGKNQLTSNISISSLGNFSGTVSLTASSSPSQKVSLSFSVTSVTVTVGGRATSTLSISIGPHAATGTYTITVTGTATIGGVQVTHTTTITVVIPSKAVKIQTVTWTQILSVSASGGSQTWTATISNGGSTTQFVKLVISGSTSSGTQPFTVQSAVVSVAANGSVNITLSTPPGTFNAADIGQTINFQANVFFGDTASNLNNVSQPFTGSFTVVA